ncbi:glycoside hydrolase family 3 C-terminal domain-containing protein [Paenibacillus sp. FSL K6-1096]|uniref:glycoside hydrolase family 3 C-terminal domain-containing protein n=1 Tax=Paenibacillus sp. FSL K6-1096 TaxID=2921460 RepID=UPI0030ECF2C4
MDSATYPFRQTELQLSERIRDLLSRLTLAEKVSLMPQYQAAVERLGIGAYKHGTEAAHGISWLGKATSYPQPSGLACTWNPELLRRIGAAVGDEARAFYRKNPAVNGLTLWAPTVDMERDPRWGRTEEGYGEDPELTGQLSAALVQGIQGDHPVYLKAVATLKHFLGNNNEIDRGVASSSIDPRNMREYYLEAFKPAFKEGGAQSMMTAYNAVNGVPVILHPAVKEIVKGEWEMDGFIVSDAADLFGIVKDHKYYDSFTRSMAESIQNGIDSVTEETEETIKVIHEALREGLLTEEDLDRALSNTFRVRFRLGEFDPEEGNPYAAIDDSVILIPAHRALSLEAAKESIVLLKNDKAALPLNADSLSKVAVIGPLGDEVFRDWYSGTLPYAVTPLQGITKKLAGKQVLFESGDDRIILTSKASGQAVGITGEDGRLAVLHDQPEHGELFRHTAWGWTAHTLKSASRDRYITLSDAGTLTATAEEVYGWFVKESLNLVQEGGDAVSLRTWNNQPVGICAEDGTLRVSEGEGSPEARIFEQKRVVNGLEAAVEAARAAEIAVVFVGNHPLLNGKEEIDRPDIVLPEEQENLVKAVYAANPNTVVVIVGSYPISSVWIDEHIPAVLYTSHSGQELGNAVAEVLFGGYSPSGKLNMTWYRNVSQLPEFMDYDIIKGKRTYMYFDGEPLYPFGHGLSYAQVDYRKLSLAEAEVMQDGTISLTVELENSGSVDGDEVVQLYVQCLSTRIRRPLKQLKDFRKVRVAAGQTQTVAFQLPVSELFFWDVSREQYCVEDGEYQLSVGRSSGDIRLTSTIRVHGETVTPRDLYAPVKAENYDDYEAVFLDECRAGGAAVHPVKDGAWIAFHNVRLDQGAAGVEVLVSSMKGGTVEVRTVSPSGKLAATLAVPAGGEQQWRSQSAIADVEAGITAVYVVFKGEVLLSRVGFTV